MPTRHTTSPPLTTGFPLTASQNHHRLPFTHLQPPRSTLLPPALPLLGTCLSWHMVWVHVLTHCLHCLPAGLCTAPRCRHLAHLVLLTDTLPRAGGFCLLSVCLTYGSTSTAFCIPRARFFLLPLTTPYCRRCLLSRFCSPPLDAVFRYRLPPVLRLGFRYRYTTRDALNFSSRHFFFSYTADFCG